MDEQKYISEIFNNMMNMGNMMNCAAKFITSSDQFLIYQVIWMKSTLQSFCENFHHVLFQFKSMIFHEKSTVLAHICMHANLVLPWKIWLYQCDTVAIYTLKKHQKIQTFAIF